MLTFGGVRSLEILKGTVLVAPVLDGAGLKSADLCGAIVFDPDPLASRVAKAAEGAFQAARHQTGPVAWQELTAIPIVNQTLEREEIVAATDGATPVRLRRIALFED